MEKFSTYEDIKNYIRTVAPSMIETNEEDDQGDYVQPEIEKEIEIDPEEDEKERLHEALLRENDPDRLHSIIERLDEIEQEGKEIEEEEDPVTAYFRKEEQKKREQPHKTQEALERGFKEYMAKVRGF